MIKRTFKLVITVLLLYTSVCVPLTAQEDEPTLVDPLKDQSNKKEAVRIFRRNHQTDRIESEDKPVHLTRFDLQGPMNDLSNQAAKWSFSRIKENASHLIKASVEEIVTGKSMVRQQITNRFESIKMSFQEQVRSVTKNMDAGQCGEVRQKFWITLIVSRFSFTSKWKFKDKEAGKLIITDFSITDLDSSTEINHSEPERKRQECSSDE